MKNPALSFWLVAVSTWGFLAAGPAHAATPPTSEALKACLKMALGRENPLYQVPEKAVREGLSHYLVMMCDGQSARDLYLSLPGAALEAEFPGKAQGEFKYLGEAGGASMCYRVSVDSEGQNVNDYHCSIRLSIDSRHIGSSGQRQMAPYPLR